MTDFQAFALAATIVVSIGCGSLAGFVGFDDHPWLFGIGCACAWPLLLVLAVAAVGAVACVLAAWLVAVVVLALPVGLVQAIRGKAGG